MSHIADVPGVRIGHAQDSFARTGVTTLVFDEPALCGVSVRGGGPGTRETDALRPGNLNPPVDALVLTGGSAFGLAAADGVQRALHSLGRGFRVGEHRIPIVPAAVIFDLTGEPADHADLGKKSVKAAVAASDRAIGTVGAGINATTANLKGGVGSASEHVGDATVGALVVVNAVGAVTAANGPWFRAAVFEHGGEFGGLHAPASADFTTVATKLAAEPGGNTVIAAVATDAALTVSQLERLAASAQNGIALAVYPSHTLYDGDTIFAASCGTVSLDPALELPVGLAAAATRAVARAIARGVYAATKAEGDRFPSWHELYG
ncbi:MAG: P1 family peptidase [Pseudomonadota bacterium]